MLVVSQSKSRRVLVDWPIRTSSVDEEDTVPSELSSSPPMSGMSCFLLNPLLIGADNLQSGRTWYSAPLGRMARFQRWIVFRRFAQSCPRHLQHQPRGVHWVRRSVFSHALDPADSSAITWLLMDFRLERKWSVVGFCTGAIAGLVAITPCAGFLGAPVSILRLIYCSSCLRARPRLSSVSSRPSCPTCVPVLRTLCVSMTREP